MTRIAALETSTRQGSVALLLDDEIVTADLVGEKSHARDLLPCLDALLSQAGLRLSDLNALAVGLGPGSYTGLRVAAATALGLAHGAELDLVGVPSFEALAFDALQPGEEGVVLRDARSGAVYYARYRRHNDGVEQLHAPTAIAPAEVKPYLETATVLMADTAALRAADWVEHAPRTGAPHASAIARIGAQRLERNGPTPPNQVEPLYLRPFAARKREVAEGGRGR